MVSKSRAFIGVRGYEMRRVLAVISVMAVAFVLVSCGEKQRPWDPEVEKSTFTEIEQSIPAVREALMDLNESINKRITSKKYREKALEQFKGVADFVDILQFYYLPILNARAYIARAYREVQYSMYTEASEDIKKAIDNINKASLKSTEKTKAGFDVVKQGLMSIERISDQTKDATLTRLSTAAKQLNALIEKIKPTVVVTEEGESLIDGQL